MMKAVAVSCLLLLAGVAVAEEAAGYNSGSASGGYAAPYGQGSPAGWGSGGNGWNSGGGAWGNGGNGGWGDDGDAPWDGVVPYWEIEEEIDTGYFLLHCRKECGNCLELGFDQNEINIPWSNFPKGLITAAHHISCLLKCTFRSLYLHIHVFKTKFLRFRQQKLDMYAKVVALEQEYLLGMGEGIEEGTLKNDCLNVRMPFLLRPFIRRVVGTTGSPFTGPVIAGSNFLGNNICVAAWGDDEHNACVPNAPIGGCHTIWLLQDPQINYNARAQLYYHCFMDWGEEAYVDMIGLFTSLGSGQNSFGYLPEIENGEDGVPGYATECTIGGNPCVPNGRNLWQLCRMFTLQADCLRAVRTCYESEYDFSSPFENLFGRAIYALIAAFLCIFSKDIWSLYGFPGAMIPHRVHWPSQVKVAKQLIFALSNQSYATSLSSGTLAFVGFAAGVMVFVVAKFAMGKLQTKQSKVDAGEGYQSLI